MAKRYILGIDAGATKTHYALYDLTLNEAALYTGGCGNHEGLAGGYAELETVMADGLNHLLGLRGLSAADIDGAGLGVAGVDTQRQHGIISGIFQKLGLKHFGLANDAVLGIKCECESGAGLCAVNGTGFSVLGIDESGETVQIGGLGDWTDDKGGGGYYAQRVFAAVYGQLFKGGRPTAMTEPVLRAAGASGEGDMIEAFSALFESGRRKPFYRELSVILHTCAGEGDPAARAILEESAAEYAAALAGVLRRLPSLAKDRTEIVLVGSNFTRCECPLVQTRIEERLQEAFPNTQIVIRTVNTEPVAGALFWGCAQAGLSANEIPRDEIIKALRRCGETA